MGLFGVLATPTLPKRFLIQTPMKPKLSLIKPLIISRELKLWYVCRLNEYDVLANGTDHLLYFVLLFSQDPGNEMYLKSMEVATEVTFRFFPKSKYSWRIEYCFIYKVKGRSV